VLISHFASPAGDFVRQTPYQGFATWTTLGDFRPQTPWPGPHHVSPSIIKYVYMVRSR